KVLGLLAAISRERKRRAKRRRANTAADTVPDRPRSPTETNRTALRNRAYSSADVSPRNKAQCLAEKFRRRYPHRLRCSCLPRPPRIYVIETLRRRKKKRQTCMASESQN